MGLCNSSAKVNNFVKTTGEEVSKQITIEGRTEVTNLSENKDKEYGKGSSVQYGPIYRLLILGEPRSGKSTLIGQIRTFCNIQPSEIELQYKKAFIFENIVSSMQELLKLARVSNVMFDNLKNKDNADIVAKKMDDISDCFTKEQYEALKQLWDDSALQKIFKDSRLYMINESTKYFFDSLDRIASENYKPTIEDLITAYCPTVKTENFIFRVKNQTFQVSEFASQGAEKHYWVQLYDYTDAIIVCVSLSSYNQMIQEAYTSYLDKSLKFLEEICSEPKFNNAVIFAVLNKARAVSKMQELFSAIWFTQEMLAEKIF